MTVIIIEDFYIYVNVCTINNALGSLTKFKTAIAIASYLKSPTKEQSKAKTGNLFLWSEK